MSWDALHDRGSGRPRRTEESSGRPGRRPNPSSRPPSGLPSQNPRNRSLRARSGAPTAPLPAVIEEELWFGGHDPKVAEDTAARSMAALVGRIVGAKPFPESARRLAELTRKDVVRIEPIIQVLERDPALSARLLRLVNSAGYALRQSCTSVRHAATLVGTDRLHQIATTAAVLDLFDSRSAMAGKIIEHCTLVGAFCRYLGAHLALPVDDLFTAGFLHDIGKMMLLETEGDQYAALLEQYADQPDAIHVAERSLFGFDHAVLAAHVLTEWNIPDPVPKIVAWHHDPTRAYRVSSMMAALVQTVRLADAAVYTMVRGGSQEEFSSLSGTECASYLDISEPQLSSMWDELQALYRESIEQCRGENAPALDPRSLRPKKPMSVAAPQEPARSAELPLQFPCVVCAGPSFGNTCGACGGHMCPEHQVGRDAWCTLCARDYHSEESEAPSAMSPRLGVGIGIATVLISVAAGYETGGISGGARAGVGTILLLILAAVLAVVMHRWLLRFRFVRTRPNRTIKEALENDGGVQSLVPPMLREAMSAGDDGRDRLSENIRLSGALMDRVVIRDVPSIPEIIAPRPFDGLRSSPLLGAPSSIDEASLAVPKAPEPRNHGINAERLMAQSQSLVTLPAPAPSHPHGDLESHCHEPHHDVPPSSRGSVPASDATTPRPESATLEAIQPIVIEAPTVAERFAADATPDISDAPGQRAAESPVETAPSAPRVSTHPLAALGLHPEQPRQPPTVHDVPVERLKEDEPIPTYVREQRTTLMGLASKAEPGAVESPSLDASPEAVEAPLPMAPAPELAPVEPELAPVEPELAPVELEPAAPAFNPESPPRPVEKALSTAPHAAEVVPLASVLRKSEPPSAPTAITAEELARPVAAAIGAEMLSKMGPELQARIMDLVAERIAAAVAQQMLQSFGQSVVPIARPKASRAPMPKLSADSEAPDGPNLTKRPRKRVAKH